MSLPLTLRPPVVENRSAQWWRHRGPLRVMFVNTSLDVGGAETLLLNLVDRLGGEWFAPEVCCLKQPGVLGPEFARRVPFFAHLLAHKYDLRVLPRLTRLLRQRQIDAVVTVGAGDRMFWGRLAAWRAGVPVVLTALHSTGWPDRIQWLNRRLNWCTSGFVAVAHAHARYLIQQEKLPAEKVFVVPNGVDTQRFVPGRAAEGLRDQLQLAPDAPVVGIVAALRPEKNHEGFLELARLVARQVPAARFLVVGDGPRRRELEQLARQLELDDRVQFLGSRSDVDQLLRLMDVVVLTSHVEAAPVTILEAMACGRPFVAPAVGSIPELIADGRTGYVVPPGQIDQQAERVVQVLQDRQLAQRLGQAARERAVRHYSLEAMVRGYQQLLLGLYCRSRGVSPPPGLEDLWGESALPSEQAEQGALLVSN